MKATRGQLARIHIARKELGLQEEDYRAALQAAAGVRSAAAMDYAQAARAIRWFESRGWKPRVRGQSSVVSGEPRRTMDNGQRTASKTRFEELRYRPGMATPQELRKIEAMWQEIARGDPQKTLRAFVFRMCQVTDLRFLTAEGAYIVIEAIKKMIARRTGERVYGKEAQRAHERADRKLRPRRNWR